MKKGNQGDGGGRPLIVFDNTQIAQVEALAAVLSKKQLSDYMGVGETTMREIEGRQPDVSDAYKRGKAESDQPYGPVSYHASRRRQHFRGDLLSEDTGRMARDGPVEQGNSEHHVANIVKPDGAD